MVKRNPFELWVFSFFLSVLVVSMVIKQVVNNLKTPQHLITSRDNVWIINQSQDQIHEPSSFVLTKKREVSKRGKKVKKDMLKEAYLSWMRSVSDENDVILEMIYDEVSKYPNKNLLLAIIYNETWPKFNPWSYSKIGAMCLMQVNPHVWIEKLIKKGIIKKKSELWRIDKCIKAGNYIITYYLEKYNGNLQKALNAYVGGNKKYVKNVIHDLKKIEYIADSAKVKFVVINKR